MHATHPYVHLHQRQQDQHGDGGETVVAGVLPKEQTQHEAGKVRRVREVSEGGVGVSGSE